MFFFCSQVSSRIPDYILSSCLLRLLWAAAVPQTFLAFLWPWQFYRVMIRCFVECLSAWGFLMFFSGEVGYDFLGGRQQRWNAILNIINERYVRSMYIPLCMYLGKEEFASLYHLGKGAFASLLHCKVTCSSHCPFHTVCSSWKQITKHSPQVNLRDEASFPWGWGISM